MSHIYCQECGFQNPEAANYCARCGALLVKDEGGGESTQTFTPEEGEDDRRRRVRGPRHHGTGAGRPLRRRQGGGDVSPRGRDDRSAARRTAAIFLDDVTVSRQARGRRRARRRLLRRGPGQPERHVRQPQARRVGAARGRRRAADRQVPTDVPQSLMADRRRAHGLLTIGNVCGMLKDEFPDISISKIRYLEDQGLLAPRRTQGGYRLFSEDDVERLETILRLQRDEFLPLRVIRQELASSSAARSQAPPQLAQRRGARARPRPSCASEPGSTRVWHTSSRSSACWRRAPRRGRSATESSTWTSRSPVAGSRSSGSLRVICARFAPRPIARRD